MINPSSDQHDPCAVDLSVLVVSYNTREMTLECLRSLEINIDRRRTQVIVVDNASSDGSAAAIAQEFPWVELIALDENLGFAGGNNAAAERAVGGRLLLLNPDTIVLDGAIDSLNAFADARPKAGIWGGRTVFADGSLNPLSCQGAPSLWNTLCVASGLNVLFRGSRVFDRERYGWWKRDSAREVEVVSGCFFLIGRSLWNELGGFDPAFFMYGEETDLCLRARRLGYRPAVTPNATIVHYGGASERVREDKVVRLFGARSRLIGRHWPRALRPLGRLLMFLWPASRATAYGVLASIGKADHAEEASTWRSVVTRRTEWNSPNESRAHHKAAA